MLTAHRGRFVTAGASALLAGAFVLSVAGCGDSDTAKAADKPPAPTSQPSDDPGTPTEQPSGGPTTPTATGEASGDDLPNPCEGFTEADVTGWTGLQILPTEDGSRGGPEPYKADDITRDCIYPLTAGGSFLVAVSRTSADKFSGYADSLTVDGIGDGAFSIKDINELHVRKGELEVVVNFTKRDSPEGDPALLAVQKTIATKIIETTGA